MENNHHRQKDRKKTIYFLVFLFLSFSVLAADSITTGKWTRGALDSTPAYGFIFNQSNASIIPILTTGMYYNISVFEEGELLNMNFTDNTFLIIDKEGIYLMDWQMAFSDGANKKWEAAIFINDIKLEECESTRKLGSGGDLGSFSGTCMHQLYVGDIINLRLQLETSPATNALMDSVQLRLILQDGVSSRIVQEFINTTNNFYFNTTINNTFNTTINNTINTSIYRGIWINYTDKINNSKFAYLNGTKANSISIESLNIEGQFIHDIGQFNPVKTAGGLGAEIKRVPGLDEIFGYNFMQCRGTVEGCNDYRRLNDTNMSNLDLNITMVTVPSMEDMNQLTLNGTKFIKHLQEQIFYTRDDITLEPFTLGGPGIIDSTFIYMKTYTYPRAYTVIPEVQCTCEVGTGDATDAWDKDGGFVVCELRTVTLTTATALCKIRFSSELGNVPDGDYFLHISARGKEAQGISSVPQDIQIAWDADIQAQGG